ncbi:MAG: calcium-binding protein [Thalassovita sp.]
MTGDSGNDVLDLGDGNDIAYGSWGNDYIFGGAGDDVLNGNDNDDTLVGGFGNDHIDGGFGYDLAVLDVVSANAQIELISDTALSEPFYRLISPLGEDTLTQVEALVFNDLTTTVADFLISNGVPTTDPGTDTPIDLDGSPGNDLILGGADDDNLRGNDGDDTIRPGAGLDTLSGGDGTDTLDLGNINSWEAAIYLDLIGPEDLAQVWLNVGDGYELASGF